MLATTKPVSSKKVIAPKRAEDLTHRDLSWFASRVERGQKEVFVEIVTVTPEIAKRILETNVDNRLVNQAQVRQIADDIANGRYVLNGETIIISKDAMLNDGQHRLEAVVLAKLPIQTAMMFGVDRKARFTVDMGRQRKTGDFLKMNGVTNYTNCAATANLLGVYERGAYRVDVAQLTKQNVIKIYAQYKDEIDDAVHCMRGRKIMRAGGVSPFAVAYIILGRLDRFKRDEFFDALATGADLGIDSPILALRARLMTTASEKLRQWVKLELILKHWNAWRKNETVKRQLSISGTYPKLVK